MLQVLNMQIIVIYKVEAIVLSFDELLLYNEPLNCVMPENSNHFISHSLVNPRGSARAGLLLLGLLGTLVNAVVLCPWDALGFWNGGVPLLCVPGSHLSMLSFHMVFLKRTDFLFKSSGFLEGKKQN